MSRQEAIRKVIEEDPGETGRIEEIGGGLMGSPDRYLIVEWAGEGLAYDAYTFDTLEMVKQEIDRGGNSGDSDVTNFSVHDLDDDGKEVGKVNRYATYTFSFEAPK